MGVASVMEYVLPVTAKVDQGYAILAVNPLIPIFFLK